jgi:hypothetical protein
VLQRIARGQRPQGTVSRPATAPETAPDTENTAEADLFAWLIKNPQYMVLCADLTADDFSNAQAWQLFEALVQAHRQYPQAGDLASYTAAFVGEPLKKRLIKYALAEVPADFEPERDIGACVAKIEQAGVHKKMNAVRREMKKYPAGQVPAEVLKKYVDLQQKLKKYRS